MTAGSAPHSPTSATTEVPHTSAGQSGPSAERALETLHDSQKLIHLGRLAASIAHEVNNPLESVTNLLYLIRMEPGVPEGALQYLDLAEREMARVVAISKQTLNFARETSEPTEVSLPAILGEVLALYRRRIDEKQLHIHQRYTAIQPLRIVPGELRQIFANLIVNAIEASTPQGTLSLRVRPASAARNTRGLRITIADNGSGIPPEIRRRLGRPFFSTKGQSGTGLGLWVTRSILERYGGRLRLRSVHQSEPHGERLHGTVFALFLPVDSAQPRPGTEPRSGPVLVPRPAKSPRQKKAPPVRRTGNDA